jgi:putative hydrolase of the HAD superfamily
MPTIRVLVCDLDGVVRHFDPDIQAGVERSHGLDPGTIARIALHPTHLIPAVSGLVSDEEWRSRIADELAALIDDRDARDAMAAWSADVGSVDASVLDLLRRARRHCPVIIFSNATSRLHQDMSLLGLVREIDAVVNSSETGCPKPDHGAFVAADNAIERLLGYRPQPHEILFIDDTKANVAAGSRHGWTATHFLDAPRLAGLLRDVGLIGASSAEHCEPVNGDLRSA